MSGNILDNLLAMDMEQELLQSFIRIGLTTDDEDDDDEIVKDGRRNRNRLYRPSIRKPSTAAGNLLQDEPRRKTVRFCREHKNPDSPEPGPIDTSGAHTNRLEAELRALRNAKKQLELEQFLQRRKPSDSFYEFYTDNDRAAAVSAGAYDIKQSLQIKQKQDRSETLVVPEEADINSLIALGLKEKKNSNHDSAIQFFTKALELNANDLNALVSRSKCYLLLGEATKALEDAETALGVEKNHIRAIYQKAEALYYLGQFEQSLMYFHRGLRVRPELDTFRLGIQKTQEAIENTIGSNINNGGGTSSGKAAVPKIRAKKSDNNTPQSKQSSARPIRLRPSKTDLERRNARKLLGELCVDKEYLENLLKHPDLVRADTNTENISTFAKEAVEFLNKRQEFWRQQRPCTALPNYKNLPTDALPKWF